MLAYTVYIAFGGGILSLPLVHSFIWPFMFLPLSRRSIPIIGRRQILHRDAEHILMEKNRKTQYYLDFITRPRVDIESPLTKTVQAVLDQLSKAEATRGHEFKLIICNDTCTDKVTATACPDGTIFMSTSQLSGCCNIGQVSAILAHEMGHLIARHAAERFSRGLIPNEFADLLGSEGPISNTPAMSRLQELEADHIGLMLMSETGFNPQSAADYLNGQITEFWNNLNEETPLSAAIGEEQNGHPFTSERIAAISLIMSKAKILFEQSSTSEPIIHLEWMQIRQNLGREGR